MAASTTGASATSPPRGRTRRAATWRVVVEWTEYALPNEAELDAYRQAIGGQVHLPAELAADFYPNTLTAEVRVTAATLRQALHDGLARVQQGIPGCIPTGVHAGIARPTARPEARGGSEPG